MPTPAILECNSDIQCHGGVFSFMLAQWTDERNHMLPEIVNSIL